MADVFEEPAAFILNVDAAIPIATIELHYVTATV
jgi:hypothetical protein